jgi:hypothetical protein
MVIEVRKGQAPAALARLDTRDADARVQEEVRNVARAVVKAVVELRAGRLQAVQPNLSDPRLK